MKPAELIANLVKTFQQARQDGQSPPSIELRLAEMAAGDSAALDDRTAAALSSHISGDPRTVVEGCIAAIYAAKLAGSEGTALAATSAAFAADPALAEAARARLAQIEALAQVCGGNLESRCWLSARQKSWLEQSLAS